MIRSQRLLLGLLVATLAFVLPEQALAQTSSPTAAPNGTQIAGTNDRTRIREMYSLARRVKRFHEKMGPVQPGDWLESHPEKGQTFSQYLRSKPNTVTKQRNVLYVLPMGEFDENQHKIVTLSAKFLGLYFGCEVKTLETISLADHIPPEARRVHPNWGVKQIQSSYVLDKVLPPKVPKDAVALICFTTSDLYPEEGWNFVFGQAMFHRRVGVWSLYRNGDPKTEFDLCLKRTLRIATHETGHMFSIEHCTAYECNMCGCNSLSESDRRPLYLCPECLPKIAWATGLDPVKRFQDLQTFCEENSLADEVEYYEKALEAGK
jgi:archaemetzincin